MTFEHVRQHIVLVPGFIGFDALGQLEYYSGVTELFVHWSEDVAAGGDVALHYFDNIPTASVELRAERLRNYLVKKMRRGEFGRADRVALVGHSTGGLDIRKTLHDLALQPSTSVDGATPLEHAKLLEHCQRIAFLSTPQFGTTLADFWCDYQHIIRAEAKNAGLGLQLNRDYIADLRQRSVERYARTELELAIIDVLNESDERGGDNRQHTEEREARAELGLWLENIGRDFQIIEDLRSRGSRDSLSPAHFDADLRKAELQRWQDYSVKTRSYATCVSAAVERGETVENVLTLLRLARPFDELLESLNGVSRLWAAQPLAAAAVGVRAAVTNGPLLPALAFLHERPALIFELFHAMCADRQRPFERPASIAPRIAKFDGTETVASADIGADASDGVVNTLSMLWPYEPERPDAHSRVLVESDHGDIIGHYKLRPSVDPKPSGRRYDAYDFFPSGSGFNPMRFKDVWTDVFNFCTAA